jgi:hypothetical protein
MKKHKGYNLGGRSYGMRTKLEGAENAIPTANLIRM